MTSDSVSKVRSLPILQGILPLDRAQIPVDIIAVVILAVLEGFGRY